METNKGAIKQELITGRQTAGTIGIHFKIRVLKHKTGIVTLWKFIFLSSAAVA